MDILLVNPPYTEHVYTKVKKAVCFQPPLGLAYIAAMLERDGIDVNILDANAELLSMQETVNRLVQAQTNLVGITATTVVMPQVYQLCEEIKQKSDKMIILGGPHVTFMPERSLKECKSVDVIVRGEGELTMLELAETPNDLKKIKGITFRANGTIISNPNRDVIARIDEIPFPARHLLPLNSYRPGAFFKVHGSQGYTTLITARGCVKKCTFCSSSHFWGRLRLRSAENVVTELEELVNKYGVRQLEIVDDTFTLSPKRVHEICSMILERNLSIKWVCFARVDTITEEMIETMKRAGCYGIVFGIESGNQDILNGIDKNITLEQSRNAIEITKNHGLLTMGDFMIGLPGDTLETVKQTIDFAIELDPDRALFCITTPFPGTALYNESLEKGWIEEGADWNDFTLHTGTKFRNDNLSAEEIEQLYSKAKRRFYLRPRYIFEALKRLARNPRELMNYVFGALYILLEKPLKR